MKTTQQRHVQLIQRVIDYIHVHSAEDHDSAAVANVAQLSAFHWHRIYVAATGETAVSNLRRVRLQKSATALLHNDRPIAQIASEYGFDNLQAFTRLFSRTYGLPPGMFRNGRGITSQTLQQTSGSEVDVVDAGSRLSESEEWNEKHPKDDANGHVLHENVEIVERAPLRLVGLWHRGEYHEIGRVFEKVMAAAEIESWPRSEPFTIGVYFDNPDVVYHDSCQSFASVPVHVDFKTPEGYDTQEVKGGLHATCLHTGPHMLLEESYCWLYREWPKESEHDACDIPCHEIYLNTPYDKLPSALKTLICLPLDSNLSRR